MMRGLQVQLGAPGRAGDMTGSADDKPGSTWESRRHDWECRRQAWEHLGAQMTSLGAPVKNLGAPGITVEQSGRNNIFFGNTAAAPGNHSYYLLFNNF